MLIFRFPHPDFSQAMSGLSSKEISTTQFTLLWERNHIQGLKQADNCQQMPLLCVKLVVQYLMVDSSQVNQR